MWGTTKHHLWTTTGGNNSIFSRDKTRSPRW